MAGVENNWRVRGAAGILVVAGALVMAACGGGGDESGSMGERITDPAAVASSTPIENANLFKIQNNVVISGPDGSVGTPTSSGTPANSTSSTYEVQSGDTCGAIAAKFNITFEELRKSNRTINEGCTNIVPGDKLKIPSAIPAATPTPGTSTGGATATPTPKPSGQEYTAKDGDTCSGIAGSYDVSVTALIELNGLDPECQDLQIGQTVRIP